MYLLTCAKHDWEGDAEEYQDCPKCELLADAIYLEETLSVERANGPEA